MKKWICMSCGRKGETEDNIVMKICRACMNEMEELKKKVENGND